MLTQTAKRVILNMGDLVKGFNSAIRGYHYYRTIWIPQLSEELQCVHDPEKTFDVFARRVYKDIDNSTVGNLRREIARATVSNG